MLSEENVQKIAKTLDNLQAMSGAVADQREDLRALIINARQSSEQLSATLKTTNSAITDVDRDLVQKLPALVAKLDGTLTKLDSAAGGANTILSENRAAIHSFANDGLAQLHISDRLEGSPARYLLGKDAPKEFEPK